MNQLVFVRILQRKFAQQQPQSMGVAVYSVYTEEDLCLLLKWFPHDSWAGIFKQSMRSRNRVKNRVVVPARQATQPGGIGALESILGLL
jgi:hypothetical protein